MAVDGGTIIGFGHLHLAWLTHREHKSALICSSVVVSSELFCLLPSAVPSCGWLDRTNFPMWILIVYVLIVVVGEAVVVAIGLALDRIYPLASLPVSLSLFFAVLAFGWPLAVRWTEPKHAKSVKLAS